MGGVAEEEEEGRRAEGGAAAMRGMAVVEEDVAVEGRAVNDDTVGPSPEIGSTDWRTTLWSGDTVAVVADCGVGLGAEPRDDRFLSVAERGVTANGLRASPTPDHAEPRNGLTAPVCDAGPDALREKDLV